MNEKINIEGDFLAKAQYYYDIGDPIISDDEFDARKNKFEIESGMKISDFKFIPDAEVDDRNYEKIQHRYPLLATMEKVTLEAAEKAAGEKICSIKADGVPVQLDFDIHGNLIAAYSRGEFQVGENYTAKFRHVKFPQELLPGVEFGMVFEAVMTYEDFNRLSNEELLRFNKKKPADPRSAVAGVFRTKTMFAGKLQHLTFIPIQSSLNEPSQNGVAHSEWLKSVAASGFLGKMLPKFSESVEPTTYYERWNKWRDENLIPFPADGIVVEFLAFGKTYKNMGKQISHDWMRCVKFPARGKETIIKKIFLSASRNWLNPMAEIEPIEIEGRTFTNVSLSNLDIASSFFEGQRVKVVISGDVIPWLIPLEKSDVKSFVIPDSCPFCGAPTAISKAGNRLICTANQCTSSLTSKYHQFAKKIGMKGLGESTIETLLNNNFLQRGYYELYDLSVEVLSNMFGPKQSVNIHKAINDKRKVTTKKIISALGYIGPNGSGVSSTNFPLQWHQVIQLMNDAIVSSNNNFEAARLYLYNALKYYQVQEHDSTVLSHYLLIDYQQLMELTKRITVDDNLYKHEKGLYGKFMLSGKLGKTKTEITALLWKKGYGVTSKASEAFAIIVPDLNWDSDKVQAAKKAGLRIMTMNDIALD